MGQVLLKIPFTPEQLPDVQDFYCGDEPWEQEVAAWIKGAPDGVIECLDQGGEVWLYATESGDLVGFGALGISNWRWPRDDSPKQPINVIPAVAVQKHFQGHPP